MPGNGLKGMRLILHGTSRTSATSSRAWPTLSFTPSSITYSKVTKARGEQLPDRVFAVDRDQLVAQRVVGRMERDRERDRARVAQAVDAGHQPRRRQRDAPAREPVGRIVEHEPHGGYDVLEIRERLAHAHHHDVADRPLLGHAAAETSVSKPQLADDLLHGEVAVEALLAGGAERAFERAPRLRGNAERPAVRLWDKH